MILTAELFAVVSFIFLRQWMCVELVHFLNYVNQIFSPRRNNEVNVVHILIRQQVLGQILCLVDAVIRYISLCGLLISTKQ